MQIGPITPVVPAAGPSALPSQRARWALVLLALQCAALGGWLYCRGALVPQRVNDTASYEAFPWTQWDAALSYYRTPGYPALLRMAALFSEGHRAVPIIQYLAYCGAVFLFYCGLQRFIRLPLLACAAASMLLYSRILHLYLPTVATDVPAAAAGIAVCGLVFWRLSGGGRWSAAALTVVVVAGWMIRPAYLFLVALAPVLVWQLDPGDPGARRQRATITLLLTFVPLLGYALLRLGVVGQFGIVAFGGYNLVGISGQFLTAGDLSQLDSELRPLAEAALARRRDPDAPRTAFDDEPVLHYLRLENRYDATIWHEFEPAAAQAAQGRFEDVNSQLKRMGFALIRLHPRDYFVWVAKAVRQAAKKVVADFADNPVTLALLLAAMAVLVWSRNAAGRETVPPSALPARAAARVLLIVALDYLVLSLAIVIPVCPPLGRFTDAAAVLLPCPLAVWLASQRCGGGRKKPDQ